MFFNYMSIIMMLLALNRVSVVRGEKQCFWPRTINTLFSANA